MEIRVWAPQASSLDVVLGERSLAMERGADGLWHARGEALRVGLDYRLSIDGSEPLPDPRSAWQPHGIHGPSRLVDHGAYRWRDAGFRAPPLSAAVIYELHVGTFTPAGTFLGAIERLDTLTELGITHVELMPVAEFSGAHGWGYDGVHLYAPHHAYGTPDELRALVDACHARDLAVLLDVVYNHLGPVGNVLGRFAPYFTDRYATPWGAALNLDGAGSDEVRRYLCDNACMWLRDYHFDGLRLDAVHALMDQSPYSFLEQLADEVEQLEAQVARPLALIAESDRNDPRLVRSRDAGGIGLSAHWSDDFHHALHVALSGERTGYYSDFAGLPDLARVLREAYAYGGARSAYRRHSQGRRATGVPGDRFVVAQQNHDQVGNRAQGDRIGQLASPRRQKVGAGLLLTSPFVPLLFQGEEWAASTPFPYFTDHADPLLANAVREGRRSEFAAFGWKPQDVPDPQDPRTFASARLIWDERGHEPHRSVLAWYRDLIALRRTTPDLLDFRLDRVDIVHGADWIRIRRGSLCIVASLGDAPQQIALETPDGQTWRITLASDPAVVLRAAEVILPSESLAILSLA
jgi:maltooligosyltrehalose trehalohydrolase